MKLFKISQDINNGYDTYDSAVVCAKNEEDARHIHPSAYENIREDGVYSSWVSFNQIDKIKVEYIGKADKNIKRGVIVASFNAG